MDDRDLAWLEHDNQLGALVVAGRNVPGAVVRREQGVAIIATGLPTRLFNQVLTDGRDGADATEGSIRAAFDEAVGHTERAAIDLRVGIDDRWVPLMAELGLRRLTEGPWMPGMALHPVDPAALAASMAVPPGLEIRRITDAAGLEDQVAVASASFGPVLEAVMSPAMLERPDVTLFVGYEAGIPVTTGMGIRTGRVIGVYSIATIEAARRRGLGAAVTARVVADGVDAGCDVAVLQSSEMGLGVYRAMGFRTVVEYDLFGRPS